LAVAFLIRAEFAGKRRQIYVIKPLCTVLVIAVATVSLLEPVLNLTYTVGVLVGLLFSLGGDIALMIPKNKKAFTIGLGSFLVAHIAYTVVFSLLGQSSVWDIFSAGILLLAGIRFYRLIMPNLGSMKAPVIAYMIIISAMVNRAVSVVPSPVFNSDQARMIVMGTLLFYASDMILAATRFWKPWRYGRISLAFYYSGQLLMALAASYFV
jgi:uncharacterized membrane protein YhhN